MKTNKLSNKNIAKIILLLLFSVQLAFSQVRVPFQPRTSQASPSTNIYHIKGDFTMLGNTNLTLANYNNSTNNSNNNMIYVDVDSDSSTFFLKFKLSFFE